MENILTFRQFLIKQFQCSTEEDFGAISLPLSSVEVIVEKYQQYLGEQNPDAAVIEAAKEYLETHPDKEVRLMYGHHYRTFISGAKALRKLLLMCCSLNNGAIVALRGVRRDMQRQGLSVDNAEQYNAIDEIIKTSEKNKLL